VRRTGPAARRRRAGRAGRRLRNVDGFGLAAEQHHDAAAAGIELHHHAAIGVDRPDIVLGIDAHSCRDQEAIKFIANLADIFAAGVEHQDLRPAMGEGARAAQRRGGLATGLIEKDFAFGVGCHAIGFSEIDILGHHQRRGGAEGHVLGRGGQPDKHGRGEQGRQKAFHGFISR